MCDNCRHLEIDIKRYRKLLERSLDPLTIEIQRSRKLLALGFDPLTIKCIDGVIQELVQHKPAYALTANRSLGTSTGFFAPPRQEGRRPLARVIH
jgi:hypothetical protein